MSWAAHDPEGWNQVCLAGVKAKLDKTRTATPVDTGREEDALVDLMDGGDSYHIWGAL